MRARTWSIVNEGRRYRVEDFGPSVGLRILYGGAVVWTGYRIPPNATYTVRGHDARETVLAARVGLDEALAVHQQANGGATIFDDATGKRWPGEVEDLSSSFGTSNTRLDRRELAEVLALASAGDPTVQHDPKVAVSWLTPKRERIGVYPLEDWLQDNADGLSDEDVGEIRALQPGQRFVGGGGASPMWEVRALRPGAHKNEERATASPSERATPRDVALAIDLAQQARKAKLLPGPVSELRARLGPHPTRAMLRAMVADVLRWVGGGHEHRELATKLEALRQKLGG